MQWAIATFIVSNIIIVAAPSKVGGVVFIIWLFGGIAFGALSGNDWSGRIVGAVIGFFIVSAVFSPALSIRNSSRWGETYSYDDKDTCWELRGSYPC